MMSPFEDPWVALEHPASMGQLSGRRVNATHPWNFYWARNSEHCLLVLRHSNGIAVNRRLPRFSGIEVSAPPSLPDSQPMLVFELRDEEHRELFHHLCLNIISSTSEIECESEAIDTAIARTWRWHYLLRGGSDSRLSLERQRGLVGELLIIEQVLLPKMARMDALLGWTGPLGSPKYFELGSICIESKARRTASRPAVTITSEFQLDNVGIELLLLSVTNIDQSSTNQESSATLNEVASRIRNQLSPGNGAIDIYEARLAAVGFRWEDDYSDVTWQENGRVFYLVDTSFPRIVAAEVHGALSNVKYTLDLNACEEFKISSQEFERTLQG